MNLWLSWNSGPGVDLGNCDALPVHALSPLEGREGKICPEREIDAFLGVLEVLKSQVV